MTVSNLHDETQSLISELRRFGLETNAERLNDALLYGGTSGEILENMGHEPDVPAKQRRGAGNPLDRNQAAA
jgi:hypothetical protein